MPHQAKKTKPPSSTTAPPVTRGHLDPAKLFTLSENPQVVARGSRVSRGLVSKPADGHNNSRDKPNVEEELPPIQAPVLLSYVELSEQTIICKMMENMIQERKKILESEDEEKWTPEKCEDLFRFLRKEIFDKILIENIFISLDIADLLQSFCDFRQKYLKSLKKDHNNASSALYVTKMKYLSIQIIDEIVKELYHMEEDEFEDDEDDASNLKGKSKNPSKDFHKQFQ